MAMRYTFIITSVTNGNNMSRQVENNMRHIRPCSRDRSPFLRYFCGSRCV